MIQSHHRHPLDLLRLLQQLLEPGVAHRTQTRHHILVLAGAGQIPQLAHVDKVETDLPLARQFLYALDLRPFGLAGEVDPVDRMAGCQRLGYGATSTRCPFTGGP